MFLSGFCMHKLLVIINSMMKHNQPWIDEMVWRQLLCLWEKCSLNWERPKFMSVDYISSFECNHFALHLHFIFCFEKIYFYNILILLCRWRESSTRPTDYEFSLTTLNFLSKSRALLSDDTLLLPAVCPLCTLYAPYKKFGN